MIWKHKIFLKIEGCLLFAALAYPSLDSGNPASRTIAADETPKTKAELPLDAFQTRTLPLAKKYLVEGDLDKSKNLLETLLELDPRNAEAHLILGEICIQQKNFERASTLLKESMQLSTNPDLALKANAWLKVVPSRYTKPKAPVAGKQGLENVQSVSDDRETSVPQDRSPKILFFTASWLPEANSLADEIKQTAEKLEPKAEVRQLELGPSKTAKTFQEYSVSLLPALVVLRSDGRFVGGLAGMQACHDLKALLRAAK